MMFWVLVREEHLVVDILLLEIVFCVHNNVRNKRIKKNPLTILMCLLFHTYFFHIHCVSCVKRRFGAFKKVFGNPSTHVGPSERFSWNYH